MKIKDLKVGDKLKYIHSNVMREVVYIGDNYVLAEADSLPVVVSRCNKGGYRKVPRKVEIDEDKFREILVNMNSSCYGIHDALKDAGFTNV